jgi:hypothetical protein
MIPGRGTKTLAGCCLLVTAFGALAGMAKYAMDRSIVAPAEKTLSQAPAASSEPASELTPSPEPVTQDERYRALVVGTWEDNYQGRRTMTLKEDGTGTMVVELRGMKATLFADRLQFDMVWSLDEGRLKKRTIAGQPVKRVKMILQMMGDSVDEPILELTENRLLLLDKDGTTKYDWRRK